MLSIWLGAINFSTPSGQTRGKGGTRGREAQDFNNCGTRGQDKKLVSDSAHFYTEKF